MTKRQESLATMARIASLVASKPLPLEVVVACNAYYECPKDPSGNRHGPLVGYAGRYDEKVLGPEDPGKQKVGDVYVNFAKVERYSMALGYVADQLQSIIRATPGLGRIDGYCGAPEGGKALAVALAERDHMQYLYPEKKITALATQHTREESELIFSRHEPDGLHVIIVEDVCNNFSTTKDLVNLIESQGGEVAGIVCFLNRSAEVRDVFTMTSKKHGEIKLPVMALVNKSFPQYRQDHPDVAADIANGNVVWSPKKEWPRLLDAMMV